MVSFTDSAEAEALAERAHELMEEVVLPKEREIKGGMAVSESTLEELRAAAREYGVYAPQIAEEYGGMGYDFRDALPTFEEAGRSLLGAQAMRIAAPDEGNMHLLELHGSELQKEEYLKPLVAGDISSGFSMTEPMQGGGSDPKMLQTTARQDEDAGEWVISGHKWWTTGGAEADVFLVMARSDPDAHPYEGTSLVIVPRETEGVEVVRDVPHTGGEPVGSSHAEVKFHDARVPLENTLGPEHGGFAVAQARLGPARLTHCMRFAGMADRALDIATAYASEREAFGEPLSEKQALRHEVADHRTSLHAARTMIRHAADGIAAGDEARIEVAMAKTFTANVAQDAVDTAVQICGGNGIGKDLPLADFYENVRAFRIVDGADEVHRRSIARWAFDDPNEAELAGITRFDEEA